MNETWLDIVSFPVKTVARFHLKNGKGDLMSM